MHIETSGLSRRPKQLHQKVKSQELVRHSIVSDPPKQKVVGTVVPSHCLTAIGESEVLVAIAARNDKVIGFRRDVGRSSTPRGVTPLEVAVDCVPALGLAA